MTNDDGYTAKGIRTLAEIMTAFGQVHVVAPKKHESGMAMAVSLGLKQLACKDFGEDEAGVHWTYLDATPASCVKFGLNYPAFGSRPDIVLSGINHGSNATTGALYSGTLGATAEAALNGIPAIGVSLATSNPDADFSAVREFFPRVFRTLTSFTPVPFGTYFNVNFPNLPAPQIKGIRVTVMGMGHWEKEFEDWDPTRLEHLGITPELLGQSSVANALEGEKLYMMMGHYVDGENNHRRADHHLLKEGYITITAHKIDSTDRDTFTRMIEDGLDKDF